VRIKAVSSTNVAARKVRAIAIFSHGLTKQVTLVAEAQRDMAVKVAGVLLLASASSVACLAIGPAIAPILGPEAK
jgi:hypothetical protein